MFVTTHTIYYMFGITRTFSKQCILRKQSKSTYLNRLPPADDIGRGTFASSVVPFELVATVPPAAITGSRGFSGGGCCCCCWWCSWFCLWATIWPLWWAGMSFALTGGISMGVNGALWVLLRSVIRAFSLCRSGSIWSCCCCWCCCIWLLLECICCAMVVCG